MENFMQLIYVFYSIGVVKKKGDKKVCDEPLHVKYAQTVLLHISAKKTNLYHSVK